MSSALARTVRSYAPLGLGLGLIAVVCAPFVLMDHEAGRRPASSSPPDAVQAEMAESAEEALGQGIVSGTVTDASGEPVAGIRVVVVSASHEAWSLPDRQLMSADLKLGETWRGFHRREGQVPDPRHRGGR